MAYETPQGWAKTDFWADYVAQNSDKLTDEQRFLAALTGSIPDQGFANQMQSAWDNYMRGAGHLYSGNAPARLTDQHFRQLENASVFRPMFGRDRQDADSTRNQIMSSYTRGLQRRLRDDFSKNKKSMLDQGAANIRAANQMELDDAFSSIDADANRRGLLKSGKRLSARANASAQNANQTGQAIGNFERQLEDTQRQLNDDALAGEFQNMLQTADMNELASGQFYNRLRRKYGNLESSIQNTAALGQGLGAAGGLAYAHLTRD